MQYFSFAWPMEFTYHARSQDSIRGPSLISQTGENQPQFRH